jgi:DNA invertase Pin-like site-specific DNA recombinase
MVFNMLSVLNQFEREQVGERTRDVLRHRRAQGFKTGGDIPYGFRLAAGGRLVEAPAEQKALRRIRELRGKGYTFAEIGAELEREGYRTRRGLLHWHPQTVKRIVERAAA